MKSDTPQIQDSSQIQLRLWPAVVFALVHLAGLAYSLLLAHTVFTTTIGLYLIPLVALVGLAIWWMLCLKVPLKQRMSGLALAMLVMAWIVFTHRGTTLPGTAVNFLAVVPPIMVLGTVCALLATVRQPWPRRRTAVVVVLIGAAVGMTALRVDGNHGDLTPVLSWRWVPSLEELAEASFDPGASTKGTAAVSEWVGPNDWPSFRGSERDGRAAGITFATNWADEAPRELWRRPIGIGWSSFAVIGNYFFTQEQRGQDELVVCYEADTGNQVWINSLPGRFDDANGGGPRGTPSFHEGRLYVLGALGTLQCLKASTGETVWKRELTEDANANVPTWGFSSSPLIVDGLVVVFAGGPDGKSVLSYSLESGGPVWQAGDGTHSYSSVHLASIDDVPQLLVPSNFGIQSFTPGTGKLLWQHEWQSAANGPRCVQPLLAAPNVVMLTTEDKGTRRIDISHADSHWKVEEQWTNPKFRPSFNDTVYHEGFAYGFDGRRFVCIDTANGERRWKSKRYGGQVLLLPDMNTLLLLSDKGVVILIEATPEAHREIAHMKALDGKTWNHPVIANGKLFVRNAAEAACYQLSGWNSSRTVQP